VYVIISITKNFMFARMKIIKDMSYFKNLILLLCVASCGLGSSSGGGTPKPSTAEQKTRAALSQQTWVTTCFYDWDSHHITGNYRFSYANLYNSSTNRVTYFPYSDTTCSGTPSYSYNITSDKMSFGSEVNTSFGLAYEMNYHVSGVYIIPYDSDGVGMAVACGVSAPVLNTEYNISGCTSAAVPTVGSTGYTLLYVADDYSTFTEEVLGTNFVSAASRPSNFSGRQPDYMTYTY